MIEEVQPKSPSLYLSQKNNKDSLYFNLRCRQLLYITSEHFYPVERLTRRNKFIYVKYKNPPQLTLQNFIKEKELLSSQINHILWQIVRLMLECQNQKINHLCLSPTNIVLRESQGEALNWFVSVKGFSFGPGQTIEQNSNNVPNEFQFMHPQLHQANNQAMIKYFQHYESQFDIWSLGTLLYYIVYKKSPFHVEGKSQFAFHIFDRFKKGNYQISFSATKHKSMNSLINKCLKGQIKSWQSIKQWMISEQQIYVQHDFRVQPFKEFADEHFDLIYFLSSVYIMILRQYIQSPIPLWRTKISKNQNNQSSSLVLLLAENLLLLVYFIHNRFLQHYHCFFHLLQEKNKLKYILSTEQNVRLRLQQIDKSIKKQLDNKTGKWLQPELRDIIQNKSLHSIFEPLTALCAQVRVESNISRGSPRKGEKTRESFQWKSITIIFDFCGELIQIINVGRKRTKMFFQECYNSKVFKRQAEVFKPVQPDSQSLVQLKTKFVQSSKYP